MEELVNKEVTDTVLEVQNGFIDVNLIFAKLDDEVRRILEQEVGDGKVNS